MKKTMPVVESPALMSAKERDALREHLRGMVRVTKADIDSRAARLRADAERDLSATFKSEDELCRDLVRMANEAAEAADAELGRRCRELGIRESFRPHIAAGMSYRGENSNRERRAELRMLAIARIDAGAKEAKHKIEIWQLGKQAVLLTGTLQSTEAKAFFSNLPTTEALLPAPTMAELDVLAKTPGLKLVHGAPTGTDDEGD